MSKTFRAVVFHAPNDVRVEDRPFPDLKDWSENDAIVKVTYAGTSSLSGNGN
jgi:threonine dehydrogenase-like Zn-dependent dehydrogenase